MRADIFLAENGYAKSREEAKRLIASGGVVVNGKTLTKPSSQIDGETPPEILITAERSKYVSRGGLKLEKAIDVLGLDPAGADAVDIGASTGGFTDCLLKHGARRVRAVDVGRSQLDGTLKNDPRVISYEGMNARYIGPEDIGGKCTLAVCDVSFISLALIFPAVRRILEPDGVFAALIKPQFEAGRANIGKNGIVRSRAVHAEVISRVLSDAAVNGLHCRALTVSPIEGGDGNREYVAVFDGGVTCGTISDSLIRRVTEGTLDSVFASGRGQYNDLT